MSNVIHGNSVRTVAKTLGVDRKTIQRDITAEAERRAEELSDRRETSQATHLAKLDHLYERALSLAGTPGTGALAAVGKALELRAKILGLDVPTKLDVHLEALLTALDAD